MSSAGVPAAMTLPWSRIDQPVAEVRRLVHVVGGEEHRAAAAPEVVDDLPDLEARLRVEAGGGLVEEEQLGVADEGAGERQPLLLAAGELLDAGVALLFELHDADGVFDAAAAAGRSCGTGAAGR